MSKIIMISMICMISILLTGCTYYGFQDQTDCDRYSSDGLKQQNQTQKEFCESNGYQYTSHWSWFDQCNGTSNFTYRCLELDNNKLINEYKIDSIDGNYFLVKQ